ncbi:MAG: hypothetical protein Fur005_38930 [Roseiflexaceae bacterium]
MTQQSLANMLACSLSLLRKIENGTRKPPIDLIERLATILAQTPDERAMLLGTEQRSLVAAPRRFGMLPALHGQLIGRQAEIAMLSRRLIGQQQRLITITGSPGVGKTHLTVQFGWNLYTILAESIWYLSLETIRTVDGVLALLAHGAGLDEGSQDLMEALINHWYQQPLLLIFDNVEQIQGLGSMLAHLLAGMPQLQIICTSRIPLRIRAEHVVVLEPLMLPDRVTTPDQIAQTPAIQLFVERAQARIPSLQLNHETYTLIFEICQLCDGLPLAIELAAAQLDQYSLIQLRQRLEQRLSVLNRGPYDLPHRQQTWRDAIAWSYFLLQPTERDCFIRLSVFVGSWSDEAALQMSTPEQLDQLIRHNLIQKRTRYAMLASIHEFALEQLQQQGALEQTRQWHAAYFAATAERIQPNLDGDKAQYWFDQLEDDIANLKAAIDWSLEHDHGLIAARITIALLQFWRMRGYNREIRQWMEPWVRSPQAALLPAEIYAGVLFVIGFLGSQQGQLQSFELINQSEEIYRQGHDPIGLARVLNLQGVIHRAPGTYDRALAFHIESLAILRDHADQEQRFSTLNNLGMVLANQGHYAAARIAYREALQIAVHLGKNSRTGGIMTNLAEATLLHGDHQQALALYQQAYQEASQFGWHEVIAEALEGFGLLALSNNDLTQSQHYIENSLELFRKLELTFAIVRLLRNRGYVSLRLQHWQDAEQAFLMSLHTALQPYFSSFATYTADTLLAALTSTPPYTDPQQLGGIADVIAHALTGLAIVQLHHNLPQTALLLGHAELLHQRFRLRQEPEDLSLRLQALSIIIAQQQPALLAAWQHGQSIDTVALLAQLLAKITDHPSIEQSSLI